MLYIIHAYRDGELSHLGKDYATLRAAECHILCMPLYKYRYGSHYLLLILTYRLFTLDGPIKKVSILISCTFTNTYLVSSKYKIFFLQALSHVAVN